MSKLNFDKKLIDKLSNSSHPLAVACSGGSDSMALLHYVKNNYTNFYVINFEHGIRGLSSVKDSEFVKDYCDKNNIKCNVIKLDTLKVAKDLGLTVEEAARKLRYDYFNSLLSSKKVSGILLAHHKLDQAETILMRIFRGTGIDGLEGIKKENNGIFRPLLDCDKLDIMSYVKQNNIPYVEDETNSNTDYTRNFIRKEVLPLIKTKYPKVEDSLVRLSLISKDINEYFDDKIVVEKLSYMEVKLPLISQSNEILRRQIKKAYLMLNITQDIEFRHYELIENLVNLENGKSLKMPYNTTAYKEYDSIVIAKDEEVKDINISLKSLLNDAKLTDKVRFSKVTGEFNVKQGFYFDMDKMPDDACIRLRRCGDIFTKFGGGTKNLGDYLTDKKVPVRLRDKMLVVASQNEVLIIVGVAISDKIKINDKSQNIYKITTEISNGI